MGSGSGGDALVAEWVERWRPSLVEVALGWVGDRDQAEDLVQETLARVIAIAHSDPRVLDEIRRPYAWLVAITRNVTLDALGKQARRERILRENQTEVREQLHPLPDTGWDVDRLCERVTDAAERNLSEKQLRIIRAMLGGKTDAQISREEGVARSTVRWHRREAARSLREAIAGGGNEERGRGELSRPGWLTQRIGGLMRL